VGHEQCALGRISAVLAVAWRWCWLFSCGVAPICRPVLGAQLASLGYAVPGAVIVVGLLLPVGWLQAA
jgi:iron(III) transport system permease protein